MSVIKKEDKNSTKQSEKSKKWLYSDEYYCFNTFKKKPVSKDWINLLAEKLVTWARDDDKALKLTQFYSLHGLAHSTMEKWRRKFPQLNEAAQVAKRMLGDRREIGALEKRYDASTVHKMMLHYDKSWKDVEEWRSKLKASEQSAAMGNIRVVMEQYPSTKEVPEKNDE